eukprot:scaffold76709_cov69-Phaeocystis_antarctica.AAC.5
MQQLRPTITGSGTLHLSLRERRLEVQVVGWEWLGAGCASRATQQSRRTADTSQHNRPHSRTHTGTRGRAQATPATTASTASTASTATTATTASTASTASTATTATPATPAITATPAIPATTAVTADTATTATTATPAIPATTAAGARGRAAGIGYLNLRRKLRRVP